MALPLPDVEVVFGRLRARVRALCGLDEIAIRGDDTRASLALLEGLVDWPGGRVDELTAAERDRLLAEVWRRSFGPAVRSSPQCTACGQPFDSDFRLDDLLAATWAAPPPLNVRAAGRLYRVPNGADELAVSGLDRAAAERELTRRCATDSADVNGDGDGNGDAKADAKAIADPDPDLVAAFSSALQAAVPVLDVELGARCPECGHVNPVAFRLQTFLMRTLLREQRRLPQQLHRLARAYGWSVSEILALAREVRLELVSLIDAEPQARRAG